MTILRDEGSVVVTVNGCFDGVTPAHMFLFGYALAHGDCLVVGINDDDYIRRNKRDEPFHSQAARAEKIRSLPFVRDVVVFCEDGPMDFIRRVMPAVHCIGEEYRGRAREEGVCEELGVEIIYVPIIRKDAWSSSVMGGESVL